MKTPLLYLALIASSLIATSAKAQYTTPPGYTFGGMFPSMFGSNNYGMPLGFMNNGQSPFLTMPAPQFSNTSQPQAAPFSANPMAKPIPYWMQTPQSPARYIAEVPSNLALQNAPPNYAVFTPPRFSPSPARWAPLPGQAPVSIQSLRPINNWTIFPNASQNPAPAVPVTPPKWPPQ